jgi:hypothetical protein
MDTDDKLRRIFRNIRGERLEDVADKLIALFRAPARWEEEFDQQFVAGSSSGALQDSDTWDAVKAFIQILLTRTQSEERQQFLKDIERIRATFLAVAESPEEPSAAIQRSAALLHELQQKYGTLSAHPDNR